MTSQHPWKRVRAVALACSLVPLLCAFGCGGGKGKAHGKITVGGKKIVLGTVNFYYPDKDNEKKEAAIKSDGTYEIEDLPVGKAVVTVIAFKPAGGGSGDRMSNMADKMMKGNTKKNPEMKKDISEMLGKSQHDQAKLQKLASEQPTIPPEWTDPAKKKKVVEIERGNQEINIIIP